MKFSSIEEAVADLATGKMIIVVDDEDRENEGDIIVGAAQVTPEIINFMVKVSSGLICVPMPMQMATKLGLPPMVPNNSAHFGVNFTVSIDAARGITTGASAVDKVKTIQKLVNAQVQPNDFVSPGHIFPLVAQVGGVLVRNGHTEAAVDLVSLAGLPPIGVISEITNEDGSMARGEQLFNFARKHQLKIITIKDLIVYRMQHEKILEQAACSKLPTKYGLFDIRIFKNKYTDQECVVLTKGDIVQQEGVITRIHSECFTGDTLGSLRCDCGEQLDRSLRLVSQSESGLIIYLKQEGRGIGLLNKIKAYGLQEDGCDTIDANTILGFAADLRDYGMAYQVLRFFDIDCIKLITNNPDKIKQLNSYGIKVLERISLEISAQETNKQYLLTKKNKLGHIFSHI